MPLFSRTTADTLTVTETLQRGVPIQDTIANAEDGFPDALGHVLVSTTAQLVTFTTESADPTEIGNWGNGLGYTGWLKLVVPTLAQVHIEVVPTTDVYDTVIWLYDAVPTATSVNIAQNDDGVYGPNGELWSVIDVLLAAGTYYLCVTPYDGPIWNTSQGGHVSLLVGWGPPPIVASFDLAAMLRKVWAPRLEIGVPTFVASSSATSTGTNFITIPMPSGVQDGDTLLAVISWDKGGNYYTYFGSDPAPIGEGGLAWEDLSPTYFNYPDTGDHALQAFTRRAVSSDAPTGPEPSSWTFRPPYGWGIYGAKAGVILAFRNAASIEKMFSIRIHTIDSSSKSSGGGYFVVDSDLFNTSGALWVGAYAGGQSGITTWTLASNDADHTNATERVDVGISNASLMLGTWNQDFNDSVASFYATPSQAEFQLTNLFWVHGFTTQFSLRALLGHMFQLDAVIQAATHTTHPRTGPHYGVNLDTSVVISAALGTQTVGTDLHAVLQDLDGLITNLENKA